jgi:hypothetical protein
LVFKLLRNYLPFLSMMDNLRRHYDFPILLILVVLVLALFASGCLIIPILTMTFS